MNEEFDIDAGVADIADSLGFTSNESEDIDNDNETDEVIDDENENDGLQEENTEATEEVKEEETEEEKSEETAKAPPSSWAKEQHEHWAKIPKEAQDYIELREKQMLDGIEQYKSGYKYGNEIYSTLQEFKQELSELNLDDKTVIHNLLSHHRALTRGTPEQRQQAFLEIGYQSGIIPKEGQELPDQRTRELQERLTRLEQQEKEQQKRIYEAEYNKVVSEVEKFASDPKNKYFNDIADDVVALLQTGLDLQSAYDKAVWANPVTRAKEIERERLAVIEKSKKEAEAAKKATSANIKAKPTTQKAQAAKLGSWDDTMNDVLRNMRS